MPRCVLLDTSFLVHLLKENSPLHNQIKEYFRYFLQNKIVMKVSTIAIAEYCVKGNIEEIPFENLQIVSFNIVHSKRAGEFAKCLFEKRGEGVLGEFERKIIPNDVKLFSQADIDREITHFMSTDEKATKPISFLRATSAQSTIGTTPKPLISISRSPRSSPKSTKVARLSAATWRPRWSVKITGSFTPPLFLLKMGRSCWLRPAA